MRRLLESLTALMRLVSIAALAVMVAVIVLQVTARYLFRTPVGWTEEVAVATMIWITFVGSFVAFTEKKHMRISLLFRKLDAVRQRVVLFAGNGLLIVLNVYVVYWGVQFANAFVRLRSPYLRIPMYYHYMLIPIAAGLWILYLVIENIEILRNSELWKYELGGSDVAVAGPSDHRRADEDNA